MESERFRARVWLEAHESELLGHRLEDVKDAISQAGFEIRDLHGENAWLTQDLNYNRLNLWISDDNHACSRDFGGPGADR